MIKVNARARRHEDNSGDPLDGLVNLFDLGIVLSVGFLLAALSALNLAGSLTDGEPARPDDSVVVPEDSEISEVPPDGETVIGQGEEVGTVYRLDDGRLVYVLPGAEAPGGAGTVPGAPRETPGG